MSEHYPSDNGRSEQIYGNPKDYSVKELLAWYGYVAHSTGDEITPENKQILDNVEAELERRCAASPHPELVAKATEGIRMELCQALERVSDMALHLRMPYVVYKQENGK